MHGWCRRNRQAFSTSRHWTPCSVSVFVRACWVRWQWKSPACRTAFVSGCSSDENIHDRASTHEFFAGAATAPALGRRSTQPVRVLLQKAERSPKLAAEKAHRKFPRDFAETHRAGQQQRLRKWPGLESTGLSALPDRKS